MDSASAAAVIIGNEVLTAKVPELNGAHLIKRLRERGVPLSGVWVVPDDVDAIVEAVLAARRRARWVVTSGGIGPTHDDVTVRAVALALGRKVVLLPEMEALVRRYFGESVTAAHRRLAEAPEGSELIFQDTTHFPVLACEHVYLLPGVPQLFRWQLEAVLARLPHQPVFARALYLDATEAAIASTLDAVALAFPHVPIGSYPTFDREADYRVKLTVEHRDAAEADAVVARLRSSLPAGAILREE
ncbi:MAG: competence/damage-inducible protein A [Myxococcaceae bacterium]|nr:competence/damage-inducible protein A [Myxococcaceae bacterium]